MRNTANFVQAATASSDFEGVCKVGSPKESKRVESVLFIYSYFILFYFSR